MKNKNFIILWTRDSLFAAAASLTSASVLSGHLLHTGMSEDKISFYLAAIPVVNLVISLLFSGITSKTKKTVKAYSFLCLASGILTALYALLFGTGTAGETLFAFLMILGCVLSGVTAVRNIFDYKLPCEVMELEEYSFYISISGIIGSVFGLAAGMALSYGYKKIEFVTATCTAYLIAGACYIAASFINKYLKQIARASAVSEQAEEKANVRTLFADRSFRLLLMPNLIRGIGMAVVPLITLLAVNAKAIAETDGATVTVFTYLATLLSCAAYAYLARRIGPARLCVLGALLFCAIVPAFFGGKAVFYFCYTVSYAGYYIVNNSIPDIVYRNVDRNMMSIFHTWRLAFSTVGTAAATAVIGKLVGVVSPVIILTVGVLSNVICAAAYYAVFERKRNG